jgi:hypothetical protein
MSYSPPHHRPSRSGPPRHVVLGTALLLALAVSAAPRLPTAHAEEPPSRPDTAAAAVPSAPAPPEAVKAPPAKAKAAVEGAATPSVKIRIEADTTVPADAASNAGTAGNGRDAQAGATRRSHKVRVLGIEGDREYDSFSDLVHEEPWLGMLIFWSVTLVFVTPLLVIVALVWYKVRKTRMLNETMLKLAEKGIVPPGEAMEAMAVGKPVAATGGGAPAAALYEQAKQVRRRVAWSDLRKGVVLGGIGAALALASIINDGEANGLGLVLLFVGVGYVVLWWFEERQAGAPRGSTNGSPPGA